MGKRKTDEHEQPADEAERVTKAQERAANAQYRASRQAKKAAKAQRRASGGGSPRHRVARISGKACAAIAVAVVIVAVGIGCYVRVQTNPTQYLTTAQLTKIVKESKLSTTEYRYDGIAYKNEREENGKRKFDYAIYYEADITASVDIEEIGFKQDDEAKTVTPILPEVQIEDPAIDVSSLDYLPKNPNADQGEVLKLCKADALAESKSAGGVMQIAEKNLRSAVEGLTLPLVESCGYELVWDDAEDGGENDGE